MTQQSREGRKPSVGYASFKPKSLNILGPLLKKSHNIINESAYGCTVVALSLTV